MPNFLSRTRSRRSHTHRGGNFFVVVVESPSTVGRRYSIMCAKELLKLRAANSTRGHARPLSIVFRMRAPFPINTCDVCVLCVYGQSMMANGVCGRSLRALNATQKQQRKSCLSFDLFSYQIQCVAQQHAIHATHTYTHFVFPLFCAFVCHSLHSANFATRPL